MLVTCASTRSGHLHTRRGLMMICFKHQVAGCCIVMHWCKLSCIAGMARQSKAYSNWSQVTVVLLVGISLSVNVLQQAPTSAQTGKRPASQPASRPVSAATEPSQAATTAGDAKPQSHSLPGSSQAAELSHDEPVPTLDAPSAASLSAAFEPRAVERAAKRTRQGGFYSIVLLSLCAIEKLAAFFLRALLSCWLQRILHSILSLTSNAMTSGQPTIS